MNEEHLLKAVKEIRTFRNQKNEKLSETQESILRIIIRDSQRLLESK